MVISPSVAVAVGVMCGVRKRNVAASAGRALAVDKGKAGNQDSECQKEQRNLLISINN
jgi:hypothetical protein